MLKPTLNKITSTESPDCNGFDIVIGNPPYQGATQNKGSQHTWQGEHTRPPYTGGRQAFRGLGDVLQKTLTIFALDA